MVLPAGSSGQHGLGGGTLGGQEDLGPGYLEGALVSREGLTTQLDRARLDHYNCGKRWIMIKPNTVE